MKKILYILLAAVLLLGTMLITACEPTPQDHVHTFTSVVVEPTCNKKGYTEHTCECGYVKRDTFTDIDLTKHVFEKVEEVASTCTEAGYLKEICSACGEEQITDKKLESHKLGEWYVAVESTCTEKGTQRRDCELCEYFEEKKTELASHQYGEWEVSVEAGCEGGEEKCACVVCGDEKTRSTDPVHEFTLSETIKPTCTEYGYKIYVCELCEHTEMRDYAEPNGHDYKVSETVKTTCTEQGYTMSVCSVCADVYVEPGEEPKGHDYCDTVTLPTCTEMGYTTYTCSVCSDEYTDNYTSPTHNYGDWTTVIEAECPSLGLEERICECGHKEERAVQPEHVYVGTVTAPTYNTQGYTTYTCACGSSYVDDYVPFEYTEELEYKLLADNSGYILVSVGDCSDTVVIIPETVEGIEGMGVLNVLEIRHNTFEGCSEITEVVIPEGVTVIGISAFEGCESLTSIIYRGTVEQWELVVKNNNWDIGTGDYTVHCTDGDISK